MRDFKFTFGFGQGRPSRGRGFWPRADYGGGFPGDPYSGSPGTGGGMPPQPPGQPFGPPPGQPGPMMYGQPSQESSAWKVVLIGCLALLLLGILATAGMCYFFFQKGGEFVTMGLEAQKAEYVNMLSADHSEEDKDRFASDYQGIADEYKRLGLVEWSIKYGEALTELETISQDREIDLEESRTWCEHTEMALRIAGYPGLEDSPQ